MTVEGLGLSILPIDMMQEEIEHKELAVELAKASGIFRA